MSVLLAVLATGYVDPVVETVLCFQDELVKIGMLLEEGEPTMGHIHVGVTLVVFPRGVPGLGKADVGRFAQGVLAGINASYLDVERTASVAGTDDDGLAGICSQGLEDGTAELFQSGNVLHGNGVVDTMGGGYSRALEFFQAEMF